MSQKSMVWKFFETSTIPHMCKCKLCDALVTRGGKSAKSYGTSSMKKHLLLKHKKEYESENRKKDQSTLSRISSETSVASTSTSARQMNVIEAFEKKKLWDINDHRAVRIHKIIGKMITLDIQPFSIVEDIGFSELVADAYPNYKLPSRKYFSENVIPSMYKEYFEEIKDKISAASYLSLTTDIWTADTANIAFISLTGHWINENPFTQGTAVLRVIDFPESHTGANISEYLQTGLKSFEIPLSKIHLVVRDNAANMVAGVRNSGMAAIPCFIHTLQLCIHDSILCQKSVKEILTLCRGIATHFNHSAVAFAKLKTIQQQLNIAPHKLKQDVSTRWNSSFEMLQRMFEQKVSLATYAAEFDDINVPTQYQWGLVEKLVNILAPFEKLTKTCGRREETAAQIIPSILALKVLLNKASSSDKYAGIMTMVDELKNSVTKRLDKFLLEKVLCVSTFLDPRYKLLYQHAKDNVVKTWVEEAWAEMQEIIDYSDSDEASTIVENASPTSGFVDIDDCFDEIATLRARKNEDEKKPDETEVAAAEPTRKRRKSNAKILQEIDSYLSLPIIGKEESPFEWWGNCGKQYEKLRKIAAKYLTAPPSSIESERLFSSGGDIYEATRNRLKSNNGEYLMFIHYNLKLNRQLKNK